MASDAAFTTAHLSGLRSAKSSARLQQIANLRARGVGQHIDLPQLVVCGDQSAGKSSVLEGLTGVPFPRQDGLCTTFPTEIQLSHVDEPMSIQASIIPAAHRDEKTKTKMNKYQKTFTSFDDLARTISEVSAIMGLRGSTAKKPTSTFTLDILRIHIKGNTGLQLTVVDLPGLISVPTEEQTQDDVNTVHRLVDDYCRNPRTIILAVVQASNDIANQAIIQKSKLFDLQGVRTVGIITKPDLVNKGTEARIARLAKNEDTTKLKLGFFILKNPTPADIKAGVTQSQRLANEHAFFDSPPWKDLGMDRDRVGVQKMQVYLQSLLSRHIESEMPKVRDEVSQMLQASQTQLENLGEERSNESQIRTYLSRTSMQFHTLVSAGARGEYHSVDVGFFNNAEDATKQDPCRLRALVHTTNQKFADEMRTKGHMLHVAKDAGTPAINILLAATTQQRVSTDGMNKFVKDIYHKTRGLELPGTQNHVLLTELFHFQSKKWQEMAEDHVEQVSGAIEDFLRRAVNYICPLDERLRSAIFELVQTALFERRSEAQRELKRLVLDKNSPPVTYNHYFTDNVIKSRESALQDAVKQALIASESKKNAYNSNMNIAATYSSWDIDTLATNLQQRVNPSMDDQACAAARESLDAFYKVACKTFVDNVCIQVIERHFMRDLGRLFSPETVAAYSTEELTEVAGEDIITQQRRKDLKLLVADLKASLKELKRQ